MNNSDIFNRFTERARRTLALAQAEAQSYQHKYINPEHLLLGLVDEGENVAVKVLNRLGVDLNIVHRAVEITMQRGDSTSSDQINLAPRGKQVIELAVAEARLLNHDYIGTEHLLLGIVSQGDGIAAKVLERLGVTLEKVRTQTVEVLSQLGAAGEPTAEQSKPPDIDQAGTQSTTVAHAETSKAIDSRRQTVEIDANRQQRIRAYVAARQYKFAMLAVMVGLIFVVAINFGHNLNIAVHALLQPLSWQPTPGWYPFQVLAYFLILVGGFEILYVAFLCYADFRLPHRYDISTRKLRDGLVDLCKIRLLKLVELGLFIELIYLFLALQPLTWWFWMALIQFLFTTYATNLKPILIFPLFFQLTPIPEGDLTRRLAVLTHHTHTHVQGIYKIARKGVKIAPNAYFVGWGKTFRILLADTLLSYFTHDEIEVILAHELSHLVHYDIWKRTVSESLLQVGGFFLINLALQLLVTIPGHLFYGIADVATLPFMLVFLALSLLIVRAIHNKCLRTQEIQADEYSLQMTGMVTVFKNAMTRLTNLNLIDAQPSSMGEFASTHPSLVSRLKHADEFAARHAALTHSGE